MIRPGIATICCFGLLILLEPTRADAQSVTVDPGGPAPGTSRIENLPPTRLESMAARHHRDKSTPVPATLEIEVLDPNVDPLGNPAVVTREVDGKLIVDIPPVVLVHRYYYTGERTFQGPMLPGGPSIVVVSHPRTGERLYLELQMLPGAPKVTYARHSIEYDYGHQAITIAFGLHGKPRIDYRQGVPISTRAKQATISTTRVAGDIVRRTGAPAVGRKVVAGVGNIAETSADRAKDLGKAVTSPIIQVVKATPLANLITSSPEERAERGRDALVAGVKQEEEKLDASIKTVR